MLNAVITRKAFVRRMVGALVYHWAGSRKPAYAVDRQTILDRFSGLLGKLEDDPSIAEVFRRKDDWIMSAQEGEERTPIRTDKSTTVISPRAIAMLVACEVTSRNVYSKRYTGATWPGRQSGVTIGFGYDIGYVNGKFLKEDWKGYLDDDDITVLTRACGKTGTSASDVLKSLSHIQIGWDSAQKQFLLESCPRYVGLTKVALGPNTKSLSPDSLGALVSLVYNRGPSFKSAGDRYKEMRNIQTHVTNLQFDKIPGELRCMKRIWAGQKDRKGVLLRRDAEADLFEIGLHV